MGDGGPATSATLNDPYGVAVDAAGNLYITDSGDFRVRKVSTSGTISTVAGTGSQGFSGDSGPATLATLSYPLGLAVDAGGNLEMADSGNSRVRRVGGLAAPTPVVSASALSIAAGQSSTLSVVNSGLGPFTYQWYQGTSGNTATPIPGATNSNYTTPTLSTTTSYWVLVGQSGGGSLNSSTITINVLLPQVSDTASTVTAGQSSTLTAEPSGSGPFTYQWYQGPSGDTLAPIAGATGASFTTPPLSATTTYWVQEVNGSGVIEDSNAVTITVNGSSAGTGSPTDGPVPLWALFGLGAGLMGIASRRLKRAA